MEDRRFKRMRSLAPHVIPTPLTLSSRGSLLCHPKALYFVIPRLFTLSSRGSARDLGLAPSHRSLLPPRHLIMPDPDRKSIPGMGRSPCRRSAEAEAESKVQANALIRPHVIPTPLTLSSRGPLLCHPKAPYFVIPRPREGSRTYPFTSLSTTPPSPHHARPRSEIHPRDGPLTLSQIR